VVRKPSHSRVTMVWIVIERSSFHRNWRRQTGCLRREGDISKREDVVTS